MDNSVTNKIDSISMACIKSSVHNSPTVLKNVLGLVLQTFLCSEALESKTIYDWLNRTG